MFVPLFCRAAENNVGVARLMDFIAKYGSSPVDRKALPAIDANGKGDRSGAGQIRNVAYVFKTMSEAHFGELSFFRVYSGAVNVGSDLFNSDRKVDRARRPDLPAERPEPRNGERPSAPATLARRSN